MAEGWLSPAARLDKPIVGFGQAASATLLIELRKPYSLANSKTVMSMSSYYRNLRDQVGHGLLILPGVAGVLRDEADRVLLQRNWHGAWSLPAGAVEPGEPPARAIQREVFEETGLRVRVERVLGVVGGSQCRVTYPNGDQVEYISTVFECARIGGELIASNEETSLLRWFPVGAMPSLAFPYPAEVLGGSHTSTWFAWDDAWTDPGV